MDTKKDIWTIVKLQRQLLPLLLLTFFCLKAVAYAIKGSVVVENETYEFTLTVKHYLAFTSIAINLLTYFLFRQYYKYTLALTIIFGLFNFLNFSDFETTQSYSFNNLSVSFQPSPFLAGILAYFINFSKINYFVIDHLVTKKTPEERAKIETARFKESVEKFKERYKSYSTATLTEILNENKFTPEALEAARQLLKQYQKNDNTDQQL